MQKKSIFLPSLFSRKDWFETSFVGNPEDRFSRVVACVACSTALGQIFQVQRIIILKTNIMRRLFIEGAQWLSGRVLDLRPKGRGFEPHRRPCVVSLSKNINPSLVLVQPRKTRPFITERLLMGRKESNQTKQRLFIGYINVNHII